MNKEILKYKYEKEIKKLIGNWNSNGGDSSGEPIDISIHYVTHQEVSIIETYIDYNTKEPTSDTYTYSELDEDSVDIFKIIKKYFKFLEKNYENKE